MRFHETLMAVGRTDVFTLLGAEKVVLASGAPAALDALEM